MNATYPTARSVRHAFTVLGRLPAEALINLTERLIDCLDLTEPDCDLEPEEDACNAGECGGLVMRGDGHPGDADDAEPEEDDDDDAEDEPLAPGTLRPERDGLVQVWRKPARGRIMDGRSDRSSGATSMVG